MSALLWRILIAVVAVLLISALIPPVARVIGFPVDGDVLLIVRLVVAGLALFYILKGPPFPPA